MEKFGAFSLVIVMEFKLLEMELKAREKYYHLNVMNR
jgi:hypothetical protein